MCTVPNVMVESFSMPDAYQVNHSVYTGGCTELGTASPGTVTAHCMLQLYVADIQSRMFCHMAVEQCVREQCSFVCIKFCKCI